MNSILVPILQAVEPNDDGVLTDNELLWIVLAILVVALIVGFVIYISDRRNP